MTFHNWRGPTKPLDPAKAADPSFCDQATQLPYECGFHVKMGHIVALWRAGIIAGFMRPNFGQLASPLAAILLTAVTTAHAVVGLSAFCSDAQTHLWKPDRLPVGSPPLGSVDHPGDMPVPADPDDNRGDLGFQPVLLLDRVVKPAIRFVPVHTPVQAVGGQALRLTINAVQSRNGCFDAEVFPRPARPLAGLAMMPHGPPSAHA